MFGRAEQVKADLSFGTRTRMSYQVSAGIICCAKKDGGCKYDLEERFFSLPCMYKVSHILTRANTQ